MEMHHLLTCPAGILRTAAPVSMPLVYLDVAVLF